MDPKIKILIENLNIVCKFWIPYHEECCRFSGELTIGNITYQEDPPTKCAGKIQQCEREPQDIRRDPPILGEIKPSKEKP